MNYRFPFSKSVTPVAALLAFPLAASANSLIVNGNFQQKLSGWSVSNFNKGGSVVIDSQSTRGAGSPSCKIISPQNGRVLLGQDFPLEPNRTYQLKLWYRTPQKAETEAHAKSDNVNELAELQEDVGDTMIRFVMRPPAGALSNSGPMLCYVGNESIPQTFGKWKQKQITFKTHPLTAVCRLEINVYSRTLWLDSIEVIPTDEVNSTETLAFESIPSKPLYRELFSEERRDADVYLNWAYNFAPNSISPYALKFGIPYRYEDQYKEAGDLRLTSFDSNGLTRKYQVPELLYVHNTSVIADSKAGRSTEPPYLHPTKIDLMLQRVDAAMRRDTSLPWGVFYADEPFYRGAVAPKGRHEEDAAYWKEVDKEVKEKYGNGIYGIPTRDDDSEPYHWIAFRRWADDQTFALYSKIKERVRQASPDIKLVGPDELSIATPRDWERLAQTWTISTGQALPAWNAIYKNNVGYLTKFYSDLTFRPVAPFVQISAYDHAATPELARDLYSQALRNGGESFWINGVEWYDRELVHPKLNSPDRWTAMKELAQTVRETPRLKHPKADSAIFYSLDTEQALPRAEQGKKESVCAYVYLGPRAGSWFNFISERQVLTGSRNLSDYKAIYLPNAKYMRASVAEKFIDYVQQGGTLICGDPEVLSTDDFGTPMANLREALFGVKVGEKLNIMKLTPTSGRRGLSFPEGTEYGEFTQPRKLTVAAKTKVDVVMQYSDGSPGLTLHHLGKGKALLFANNPFQLQNLTQPEWTDVMLELQRWAGAKTHLDIWRFMLPMKAQNAAIPENAEIVCLTGNNVQMVSSVAFLPNNVPGNGTYRYEAAPSQEPNAAEPVAFEKGKLTNRPAAFKHAIRGRQKMPKDHVRAQKDDWSITWDDPQKPLVVTFQFAKRSGMDRLVLYVSGEMPDVSVVAEGEEIGRAKGQTTGPHDLEKVDIPLQGAHQTIRVQFSPSAAPFTLAEAEVWGKPLTEQNTK